MHDEERGSHRQPLFFARRPVVWFCNMSAGACRWWRSSMPARRCRTGVEHGQILIFRP